MFKKAHLVVHSTLVKLVNYHSINLSSGWLPPADCWSSSDRLPYGWETAADVNGKNYFVNHLNKTTTVEDPRKWDIMEQVYELLTFPV